MKILEDRPILLVGLDFETTGLDVAQLRPLQIGVFIDEPRFTYRRFLRYEEYALVLETNDAWKSAEAVHQIDPADIINGQPIPVVDRELHDLLLPLFHKYVLVATGFGVGPYDVPILQKWFPRTAVLFSHRVVDPNTPALLKAANMPSVKALKEALNHEAEAAVAAAGVEFREHDALSDAAMGVFAAGVTKGWMK